MFNSVKLGGRGPVGAVVVGQFKGEALDKASAAIDESTWAHWASTQTEATGELGRVVNVFREGEPSRVVIVGLGPREAFAPARLRDAAAALGRFAAGARLSSVELALDRALAAVKGVDLERCGRCFGEGLGLIAWRRDLFKGSGSTDPKRTDLAVRCADTAFEGGLGVGLAIAASVNYARTMSETPPNICTPAYIADQARKMARGTGLKVTVMEGADLERERFTGLVNVGKASENKPCMIRIEYAGSGGGKGRTTRGGGKPIVLIGKTMTYDSGGLSLKVNNGMRGMKRDKDGGCAVLGAMHAIATVVKPRRPVVAFLACAENSVSDEAYRPDDIIKYRNGVTVEVTNTDAEGRLVLADALCYACDTEKPAAIIDLATLTGGVVVALGSTYAGLFCEDDKLRAQLDAASEASGERIWRLPMHDEYRDLMKSPVADIQNSNPVREAHPIQGAAFLSYFVEKNIPWAHLDIAGVHATEKDKGPFVAGPTGWGVRLLAELVERM